MPDATLDTLIAAASRLMQDGIPEPTFSEVLNEIAREDEGVVQVRIAGTSRSYAYRCLEAEVGDVVLVPAAPWGDLPQIGAVTGLGRGGFQGPLKSAVCVPDSILEGRAT